MSYEVANIRTSATNAIPILLAEYYATKPDRYNEIVNDYIKEIVSTNNQVSRMGHCLALGSLPKFALLPNLEVVITSLVETTYMDPQTVKWAEARRDAVKALTSIALTLKEHIGKGRYIASRINTFRSILNNKNLFNYYFFIYFAVYKEQGQSLIC